jgi:hypothetical protein
VIPEANLGEKLTSLKSNVRHLASRYHLTSSSSFEAQ